MQFVEVFLENISRTPMTGSTLLALWVSAMVLESAATLRFEAAIRQPANGGRPGGGGGPRELASDKCLSRTELNAKNPSELEGYGSCFKYSQNDNGTADVYLSGVPDHGMSMCFGLKSICAESFCRAATTFLTLLFEETLPMPISSVSNS